MEIIWRSYENHMEIIWKSYENHMKIKWKSYGNSMNISFIDLEKSSSSDHLDYFHDKGSTRRIIKLAPAHGIFIPHLTWFKFLGTTRHGPVGPVGPSISCFVRNKRGINHLYIDTGWWLGHPFEKYESQLGWLFPILMGKRNVPNHQPVTVACLLFIKGWLHLRGFVSKRAYWRIRTFGESLSAKNPRVFPCFTINMTINSGLDLDVHPSEKLVHNR